MHIPTPTLLPLLITATPLLPRQESGTGQCSGAPNPIDNSAASDYTLYLSNGQDAGLCQGFLDNLHGTCGDRIINWKCGNDGGNTGISFTAPVTCQGWQIQNTVWVATLPHVGGVECSWYGGGDGGVEGPDGNGWWDAIFTLITAFGHD